MTIAPTLLEPYYRAAVLGLRALETRAGRRKSFGTDADARWNAFRGELRDGDRLDLLLRAAAKGNPAAFAPRVLFPLAGLADDEPFGPDWPGAAPQLAADLVREAGSPLPDPTPKGILASAAAAWGLAPKPLPSDALASLGPATRLVAAGAGAILSLGEHFAGRQGLDLAQQVLFVASSPGERQLAGLAVALTGSTHPVQLCSPGDDTEAVRSRFSGVSLVLVSTDASPSLRALAEAVGGKQAR